MVIEQRFELGFVPGRLLRVHHDACEIGAREAARSEHWKSLKVTGNSGSRSNPDEKGFPLLVGQVEGGQQEEEDLVP